MEALNQEEKTQSVIDLFTDLAFYISPEYNAFYGFSYSLPQRPQINFQQLETIGKKQK
jgi:hypothetical protein